MYTAVVCTTIFVGDYYLLQSYRSTTKSSISVTRKGLNKRTAHLRLKGVSELTQRRNYNIKQKAIKEKNNTLLG